MIQGGQNSFGFYVLLAQLMKWNVFNKHLLFCPSQFSVRRSSLSLQLYKSSYFETRKMKADQQTA